MKDIKQQFLRLAIIDQLKYDEIAVKLNVERNLFSAWWEDLKEEREQLAALRDKWQAKCPEIAFERFEQWYNSAEKKCCYCGIDETQIHKLWKQYPKLTKRKRGQKLEIERLQPNLPYSELTNLAFSCYWCNNAKTDTFTKDEFLKIGEVIKDIWQARLKL